jgi:hypothetical protein
LLLGCIAKERIMPNKLDQLNRTLGDIETELLRRQNGALQTALAVATGEDEDGDEDDDGDDEDDDGDDEAPDNDAQ